MAIPGGSGSIPAEFKTETGQGVGKIVRVGESGLVIRTGDPLEVSQRVERVLYDPSDSKSEGAGTTRRVGEPDGRREIFVELEGRCDAYDDLFERLLLESPGGIDSAE